MSSSDRSRGEQGAARRDTTSTGPASPSPSPTGAPADPYAHWLERMQRARTRHAAITKNLYTWSNYKTWADKVKDSWEDEGEGKEKGKK